MYATIGREKIFGDLGDVCDNKFKAKNEKRKTNKNHYRLAISGQKSGQGSDTRGDFKRGKKFIVAWL